MKILNYTNEMVKDDFPKIYGEVPPSFYKLVDDYRKGLFYANPYTLRDRFNGYKNFLKECGYVTKERVNKNGVNRGFKLEREKEKRKTYINYTKKQVGDIMYEALKQFDKVDDEIISKLYNNGTIPFGEGVIKRRYGNISNMLNQIGLRNVIYVRKHNFYTKQEMIDIFKEVFSDLNNPPSQLEVYDLNKKGIFEFTPDNYRHKFGSYSKFLIQSGYNYNKGLYSQKYIALDGNICDSKSELKIDEFLHENGLEHRHQVRYSEVIEDFKKSNKCDFLLTDGTIVEYFGLKGQPKYDKKTRKKVDIMEKNNINYIAIYPNDLKRLDDVFKDYIGGAL